MYKYIYIYVYHILFIDSSVDDMFIFKKKKNPTLLPIDNLKKSFVPYTISYTSLVKGARIDGHMN